MFIDTIAPSTNNTTSSISSTAHQPNHRSHHSCVLCNQCRLNWSTLTDRLRASNRAAGLPITTTASVLSRCAGCSAVYYCSKQCQRMNWPIHKTLCREIQAMHDKLKKEPSLKPSIRLITYDIIQTISSAASAANISSTSSSTLTQTILPSVPDVTVIEQNSLRFLHPPVQLTSSQSSPQLNQQTYRINESLNRHLLPRIELYSVIEVHFILKVANGEVISRSFTPSSSFLITQSNAADAQLQGVKYSQNELNDLKPTYAQYVVTQFEEDGRTIKCVEPDTIPGLILCIQQCINKASQSHQQQVNNHNINQSNRIYAIIPPDLGYGESGIPDKVPPKSFIIAECEVHSIQPSPSRAQLLLKNVLTFVNQPMFNDDAIDARIAAAGLVRAQQQQQQVVENEMNE